MDHLPDPLIEPLIRRPAATPPQPGNLCRRQTVARIECERERRLRDPRLGAPKQTRTGDRRANSRDLERGRDPFAIVVRSTQHRDVAGLHRPNLPTPPVVDQLPIFRSGL